MNLEGGIADGNPRAGDREGEHCCRGSEHDVSRQGDTAGDGDEGGGDGHFKN